jgi:hypothetical protein
MQASGRSVSRSYGLALFRYKTDKYRYTSVGRLQDCEAAVCNQRWLQRAVIIAIFNYLTYPHWANSTSWVNSSLIIGCSNQSAGRLLRSRKRNWWRRRRITSGRRILIEYRFECRLPSIGCYKFSCHVRVSAATATPRICGAVETVRNARQSNEWRAKNSNSNWRNFHLRKVGENMKRM